MSRIPVLLVAAALGLPTRIWGMTWWQTAVLVALMSAAQFATAFAIYSELACDESSMTDKSSQ